MEGRGADSGAATQRKEVGGGGAGPGAVRRGRHQQGHTLSCCVGESRGGEVPIGGPLRSAGEERVRRAWSLMVCHGPVRLGPAREEK
jgi:hypothetical protein